MLRAVGAFARAEVGMRQQRHLRHEAEGLDLLGRQQRHFGDLLGGGLDQHVRVDEEQRARLQDQAAESA